MTFSLADKREMSEEPARDTDLLAIRRQYPDLTNYEAFVAAGRPCDASEWPSCPVLDAPDVRRVGEWKQTTVYGQPVKVRRVDGKHEISFFTRGG